MMIYIIAEFDFDMNMYELEFILAQGTYSKLDYHGRAKRQSYKIALKNDEFVYNPNIPVKEERLNSRIIDRSKRERQPLNGGEFDANDGDGEGEGSLRDNRGGSTMEERFNKGKGETNEKQERVNELIGKSTDNNDGNGNDRANSLIDRTNNINDRSSNIVDRGFGVDNRNDNIGNGFDRTGDINGFDGIQSDIDRMKEGLNNDVKRFEFKNPFESDGGFNMPNDMKNRHQKETDNRFKIEGKPGIY